MQWSYAFPIREARRKTRPQGQGQGQPESALRWRPTMARVSRVHSALCSIVLSATAATDKDNEPHQFSGFPSWAMPPDQRGGFGTKEGVALQLNDEGSSDVALQPEVGANPGTPNPWVRLPTWSCPPRYLTSKYIDAPPTSFSAADYQLIRHPAKSSSQCCTGDDSGIRPGKQNACLENKDGKCGGLKIQTSAHCYRMCSTKVGDLSNPDDTVFKEVREISGLLANKEPGMPDLEPQVKQSRQG